MKPYRLNLKSVIGIVGLLSLIIFSVFLVLLKEAKMGNIGETLLNYSYIIAPVSILWVSLDNYLWHTKFFQSIRKSLNIPPDLRGRWEGILENIDGSPPQKFVIEIKQKLTSIMVHSFSEIANSTSILSEIASDTHEEHFMLGYLWQGIISDSTKEIHQGEVFQGYTMLNLNENENPKTLQGTYFTNRKGMQTRGGIRLTWTSYLLKKKFE
jgi:SMODS-associating 2TM, beta-strand rich effector domain